MAALHPRLSDGVGMPMPRGSAADALDGQALDITLADILAIVRRAAGRILLVATLCGFAAFVLVFNLPDRYEVRGLLAVGAPVGLSAERSTRRPPDDGMSALSAQDMLSSEEVQQRAATLVADLYPPEPEDLVSRMISRVRQAIVDAGDLVRLQQPGAARPPTDDPALDDLSRRIAGHLSVKGDLESGSVQLGYQDNDPRRGAEALNRLMDGFVADWQQRARAYRARLIATIQVRLAALREDITARSDELSRLRQRLGLDVTPAGTVLDQRIAEATQRLAQESAALAAAKARYAWTERSVRSESLDNSGDRGPFSQALETLREERARAAQRLAAMEAEVGPRHPARLALTDELRQADAAVAAEIRRVLGELQRAITAAEARETSARDELEALQRRSAEILPQRQLIGARERELTSLQASYDGLTEELEQQRVALDAGAASVRVASYAVAPSMPAGPRRLLAVVLTTLVAGLGAALVTLFFGTANEALGVGERCRALVGARQTYPLPVLPRRPRRRVWREMNRPHWRRGDRTAQRSGQGMAMWLLAQRSDRGLTVSVLSADPGEGKTTVAVLLAYSAAEMGARTLLIDGDMFTHQIARDLSTVAQLHEQETVDADGACWRIQQTPITNLFVGGAERRMADLLATGDQERLGQWFRRLSFEFDVVIIDTPPILAGAEALSVARASDLRVVVHDLRRGRLSSLREAAHLQRLFGLGADMLVLNRYPRANPDLGGYYARARPA